MREFLKSTARGAATLLVGPLLLSYAIRRRLVGRDAALEGSAQALSFLPGLSGDYLRRAFLSHVLDECAPTATVRFGCLFSQAGARIADRVYVGPHCDLGLVHLEKDVLLASGVRIPSGGATHGTADLDRSIREQEGRRQLVRVGQGTWVGSGAIVMADVGRHCVIGAGSVVTRAIPDYAIAVGVPARVIRDRRAEPGAEAPGLHAAAHGLQTEAPGLQTAAPHVQETR